MPTHPDDVTPEEAHRRARSEVLLDVREEHEWAAGHAPGAHHLPLGALRADRIPQATTVLCICRSGARSGRAAAALVEAGFAARNVAGGMNAWVAAGLPVVRDDGGPGTVA